MSEEKKEIAKAVGHIPSGLFIVIAKDESGRLDGFLASFVQQVSFEPLLVSLCVKPGRPACDNILKGSTFTINVVGDHEKNYLKHFWKGYDPDNSPFKELETIDTKEGGVALKLAKSSIVCKMKESFEPGDHNVVIAEVLESLVFSEESKPMTHVRKSGLDY